MNKVKVTIENGKDLWAAFASEGLNDHAINGTGKTEIEAINDFHIALEEVREMYIEDGEETPGELIDLIFEYSYE